MLYVSPDTGSQKVDKVQIGREMVVAEKSGPWLRVYANTDIEEQTRPERRADGWQRRDHAAHLRLDGGQGRGGRDHARRRPDSDGRSGQSGSAGLRPARPRQRRAERDGCSTAVLSEMFPNSPLAPEAAWRAADIQWQIEKADISTLPSAHEKEAYLREQMDEDDLKKVIKYYPRTRWAALAAFDLIDNKLCGDWQGSPQCPEKESEIYKKYADEYPDGPRTAQALYQAVYRMAVLRICMPPTATTRKAATPATRRALWPRSSKPTLPTPTTHAERLHWCTNWIRAFLFTASIGNSC